MGNAIEDIRRERQRQIEEESFDPAHDNQHDAGELAAAAATYALLAAGLISMEGDTEINPSQIWPWEKEWFKPKDRRRDLVRAGALIAAEIERLDREEARRSGADDG